MTASMLSVGRSAAMNTEQEAVVPSKEIRGTTAAALVAAWAVDESRQSLQDPEGMRNRVPDG